MIFEKKKVVFYQANHFINRNACIDKIWLKNRTIHNLTVQNKFIVRTLSHSYSYLSDSAGFVVEARTDCQAVISMATVHDKSKANRKSHTEMYILYWKSCSHLLIA